MARTLAVEASHYDPATDSYPVATVVFEVASQTVLARWYGAYAPVWLPSGRLLLASNEGFMQLDESYDNPTLLGDITDRVNNPAVSPDGTAIAFEYNQQIWGMNIDGTGRYRPHHRGGPSSISGLVSRRSPGDRLFGEYRRRRLRAPRFS